MTHKIIAALPDPMAAPYAQFNQPYFNMVKFINSTIDNQVLLCKAWNLSFNLERAMLYIAVARTFQLLQHNQKKFVDLDFLKKYAAEFRAAMDSAWESMSQDDWRFMCTLKETGNFKLAADILDIIERTEPAQSFV